MQDKTAGQMEATEWAGQLKEELEKRTGRKDIEVKVSPYSSYRAMVVTATDGHPIVDFHSALQENPKEVASALDYVDEMLQNWEVTKVIHKKAQEDCQPFFERLKAEFPHMVLSHNIIDSGRHCLWVAKTGDKTIAYFDLWPGMSSDDVERLITYIGDLEATLNREDGTYAEVTYFWK